MVGGMPPFLRLVPLPRQLTELPKPLALGIGLAVTIPTTALHLGQQVLALAVNNGVVLLGRGVELGTSLLGHGMPGYGGPAEDDDDEPFPTYTGLDTSAWGAGDEEAEIVRLFQDADDDESLLDELATETVEAVAQADPGPALTTEPAEPAPKPAAAGTSDAPGHAEHEPPIALPSELSAAVADREAPPVTVPERQELPVDGYDGLSATALRSKVAGLSKGELETVRDYEAGHAKRVTVLAMLERQIAKA
jgi:hypothetical protein